jgi:hypothetical protein
MSSQGSSTPVSQSHARSRHTRERQVGWPLRRCTAPGGTGVPGGTAIETGHGGPRRHGRRVGGLAWQQGRWPTATAAGGIAC